MRKFINQIPLMPLLVAAILLGLAPFVPEPHLWQKLKMMINGDLVKPIDIFDLLMHSAPAILLIIKLGLQNKSKNN